MGKRTYLVVKHHAEHESPSAHEDYAKPDYNNDGVYDQHDLPYEKAANALMSARGYLNYVEKYGYHFTDELADQATKMMENADGSEHNWFTTQVKAAILGMGVKIPDSVTWGDVAYLANMYYADLYPEVLKDEASCLKAAIQIANDKDGYTGMVFCRWTADVIGKAIKLEWEDFV